MKKSELTNLSPNSGKLSLVTLDDSAVNYDYDDKGLPYETSYSQSGVEKLKFSYGRDDRDRISSITETDGTVTTVKQYGYDDSGRLWRVEDADGNAVVTYFYDINGNRERRCVTGSGCIEYTYNGQDQLTHVGGINSAAYTYTLNGELKTKATTAGVTLYEHDPMGNLVQVVLPDTTVIGYTVDAQNRRIAKTVNGVVEYRLIYADQLTPAAKVDVDGNVIEEYIYGTGVNSPDYIKKDGVNYRVIKDHLGSTRMVVNASTGEIVKTIAYDEFGNITSETGTFDILFGYAGGLRDKDTGLIKYGARDYDPETGRWTSKEPLGFEGALNFYAYVSNDPINKIDPTGLAEVYFLMNFNYHYTSQREHWEKEMVGILLKALGMMDKGFDVEINYMASKDDILSAFSDDNAKLIYTTGHGLGPSDEERAIGEEGHPEIWDSKYRTYEYSMDNVVWPSDIKAGKNLEVVIMNHCHQGRKAYREHWEQAFPNARFFAPVGQTFSSEAYDILNSSFPGYFSSIVPEKSGVGSLTTKNMP